MVVGGSLGLESWLIIVDELVKFWRLVCASSSVLFAMSVREFCPPGSLRLGKSSSVRRGIPPCCSCATLESEVVDNLISAFKFSARFLGSTSIDGLLDD